MKNLGTFETTITLTGVQTTNGVAWNSRGVSISTVGSNDIVSKISGFLNVTAASGTIPTLVVKFQYSYNAIDWADITAGAFTTTSAISIRELNGITNNGGAGPYFRHVATLGGTTPSFTYTVTLYLQE